MPRSRGKNHKESVSTSPTSTPQTSTSSTSTTSVERRYPPRQYYSFGPEIRNTLELSRDAARIARNRWGSTCEQHECSSNLDRKSSIKSVSHVEELFPPKDNEWYQQWYDEEPVRTRFSVPSIPSHLNAKYSSSSFGSEWGDDDDGFMAGRRVTLYQVSPQDMLNCAPVASKHFLQKALFDIQGELQMDREQRGVDLITLRELWEWVGDGKGCRDTLNASKGEGRRASRRAFDRVAATGQRRRRHSSHHSTTIDTGTGIRLFLQAPPSPGRASHVFSDSDAHASTIDCNNESTISGDTALRRGLTRAKTQDIYEAITGVNVVDRSLAVKDRRYYQAERKIREALEERFAAQNDRGGSWLLCGAPSAPPLSLPTPKALDRMVADELVAMDVRGKTMGLAAATKHSRWQSLANLDDGNLLSFSAPSLPTSPDTASTLSAQLHLVTPSSSSDSHETQHLFVSGTSGKVSFALS